MRQAESTKHISMLALLDPIVAALRRRGVRASHFCPGYVQIQGHSSIYAPSVSGRWLYKHHSRNAWTRLLDQVECMDADQIANSILTHVSAAKEAK